MKKRKLLTALLLCTAVSLGTQGIAATHDTNVSEVMNKTYDGYVTQSSGGAISNTISSVIKDSTFTNNRAENNGSGGAVDLNTKPDTLTQIINSHFDNNYSNWSGGAVVQRRNAGSIEISGGSYTNNSTEYEGGALFLGSEAKVTSSINNVLFEGNKTLSTNFNDKYSIADDGGGGAIFVGSKANVNVSNATFNKNISNTVGGAIAVRNDSLNNGSNSLIVANSEFTGNEAVKDGGAIASFIDFNVSDTTFTGNRAGRNGGAVSLDLGNPKAQASQGSVFSNVTMSDNHADNGNGGAIYNGKNSNLIVSGNLSNNSAKQGGAIYNAKELTVLDGSTFTNNSATVTGSAISNYAEKLVIGDNVKFSNNTCLMENPPEKTMTQMGTIYSEGTADRQNNITIGNNVTFENNKSGAGAGMYLFGNNKATIGDNAQFINNSTQASLTDTTPTSGGGAITLVSNGSNGAASLEIGNNARFEGNKAMYAGAINVNSADSSLIIGEAAQFINNKAEGNVGGAIYNNGTTTIAKDAVFTGNSAIAGGAIFTTKDMELTDATFTNNSADIQGGAIYTSSDNLILNAVDKNVIMAGNTAKDGGDIFMNKEGANLNMNAAQGKSITVASGISGNSYNMLVNSNGGTGSLIINSAIQNAAIEVQGGTFHLAQGSALNNSTLNMASGTTLNTINNQISSFGDNVTLQDNVNLAVDVNLANGSADNFAGADVQGKVTITDVNTLGNTTANGVSINLTEALGIDPNNMAISEALQNQTQRVLTPIRYLQGGISETGMLTMAPTGNSYKDFNPAVMASPVAAQLGGYLTQLNSYDQAFRNMDMYMLMTKKQREALKLRNKYAAADGNLVFDPLGTAYDDKAVWVRPYATFENVPLKNGPKVSNVAYGSFFGADSELYDLGHGWDGMLSVYAGYNGSHQAYDGIGIYQNGGTLGITGMAYKGNFFTGLTLNAGANVGEANTAYGTDNFTMLMAGIANKTGYNIELADGKFIIQPNVQLSYSFVNTFDYTNAAGVKMNSDPLNAIQVEPGIKFIGNLKNGWQPYAGVSVVWNIMDKTNFNANNVSLPELSVKPYVRYGVGVRKTWGEVCTGFLQTYFTNGGRNGVGIQGGFRFTLGKGGLASLKTTNNMPELPATKIMLSNGGR